MAKIKLVYISGKIGEEVVSEATKEKFMDAQVRLIESGYAVMNPASEYAQYEGRRHMLIEAEKWKQMNVGKFDSYSWILLWDLHMVALCDAIYMLRDWRDSPGATAEYYYAKACGKELLFETEVTEDT